MNSQHENNKTRNFKFERCMSKSPDIPHPTPTNDHHHHDAPVCVGASDISDDLGIPREPPPLPTSAKLLLA